MKKSLKIKRYLLGVKIIVGIIIAIIIRWQIPDQASDWYKAGILLIGISVAIVAGRKAPENVNPWGIASLVIIAIYCLGTAIWVFPSQCLHGLNGMFLPFAVVAAVLLQSAYCKITGKPAVLFKQLFNKTQTS